MARKTKPRNLDVKRVEAISKPEIAWAAGLFEGEGCFTTNKPKGGRRYGKVTLGMTDEDVVKRFAEAVGFGYLTVEERQTSSGRLMYRWDANGFERVQALVVMFWPWLGSRRRARALEILDLEKNHVYV